MSDHNINRATLLKPLIEWIAAMALIGAPAVLAQEREAEQDAPRAAQRPVTQPTTRPTGDARDEKLAVLESQLRDALRAVETMRGSAPAPEQPSAPTPVATAPM